MTNDELQMTNEWRKSKPKVTSVRHSCFVILSTFDFRHSAFLFGGCFWGGALRHLSGCLTPLGKLQQLAARGFDAGLLLDGLPQIAIDLVAHGDRRIDGRVGALAIGANRN